MRLQEEFLSLQTKENLEPAVKTEPEARFRTEPVCHYFLKKNAKEHWTLDILWRGVFKQETVKSF